MAHDKELEIQRQFLDEAQEYLDTLDSALLGLANSRIDPQKINAALRAAHSIKGGAGMMGFHKLSHLAHRLEDSFKVLKIQRDTLDVDFELEGLLLSAVDCLRWVIRSDRDGAPVTQAWINDHATPVYDQLHERLGDPQEEDAASILSSDEGQDIIPLLFQTEVEGCLQRLEAVLADPEKPCLPEELTILAQELGGLGEMLQLPAFTQLCSSIAAHVTTTPPDQVETVAQAAVAIWRRSQALVLTGNLDSLPTALEPIEVSAPPLLSIASSELMMESLEEEWQIPQEATEGWDHAVDEAELDAFLIQGHTDWPALTDSIDWEALTQEENESEWLTIDDDDETIAEWTELTAPTPNSEWTNIIEAEEIPDNREIEAEVFEPDANATVANSAASLPALDSAPEMRATDFRVLEVKPDPEGDLSAPADQDVTVRVSLKHLDQLNDLMGELTIERTSLDLYLKRIRGLVSTLDRRVRVLDQSNVQLRSAYDRGAIQAAALSDSSPLMGVARSRESRYSTVFNVISGAEPTTQNKSSTFDVLEMDQYNELHLMAQEMMETIVQLQEVTNDIELSLDDTDQTARNLNKTAKQLQTKLNHVRLRPLSDLVDRFPRALRELSLQHNKPVELKIHGAETLIDRNILETLNDPLMHLLRNAFDHGIESPEIRSTRGKPATGVIEISAAQRNSRTIVTISDDGGGISLSRIQARAEQMGLDPSLLADATDEELLSLIFEPGFSTNERVTTLSGRGVGMDVVRESLRKIRGEIKVDTRLGLGTTFTLSLPFTLSIVRVLLAESNGMIMALPTDAIEEMILPQDHKTMTTDSGLIWQGNPIPLVYLSRWIQFNCPQHRAGFEDEPAIVDPTILIVNQNTQPIGLQIDRSWGEQEVAIRQVEGTLQMPSGFTMCTIMGDGRVVPLVNVPDLLQWINSCERSHSLAETEPGSPVMGSSRRLSLKAASPSLPANGKNTVLIIDDSINVRRFLALTLEKAGYWVEQAKDGQDALDKLKAGLQVQAAVCDIEMPRLDGYDFLARIKAMSGLKTLPVIMLTSRSGDKHRQLAMSLGATAYFSKPYNEQALLQTLEQIIYASTQS
ncbi:response regulator [Oculatella sp. LEGE 06141]|uniref:hybrid sensor histidine kinase/response regulator n=1 Tax=Oculatella sp. LEGE 06141 TaxID=1828648 RepID=UPI001882BF4D|nr:response regulator [Oculatella sp. LEGE 06141]MBE9182936.1 response regulator [Oculatella sp. LEGE 06141]